jgi:hypothetical protein
MSRIGPFLPRKDTAISRSKEALYSAAWQTGVAVAIQHVRWDPTQRELAAEFAADQIHISQIEDRQTDRDAPAKIDALCGAGPRQR